RFVGPANVMRPEAVRTRVCSRSSVARMSIARSVPRFHERARSTAPTNAPGVTQAVSRNSRTCAPSGTVVMITSRPSMASRGSSVVRDEAGTAHHCHEPFGAWCRTAACDDLFKVGQYSPQDIEMAARLHTAPDDADRNTGRASELLHGNRRHRGRAVRR